MWNRSVMHQAEYDIVSACDDFPYGFKPDLAHDYGFTAGVWR
jgi:hypothetical protein